jgi:hypothetical protein
VNNDHNGIYPPVSITVRFIDYEKISTGNSHIAISQKLGKSFIGLKIRSF